MKQKICRECKNKFTPARPLQIACSWQCAKLIAEKKAIKSAKTIVRTKKLELIAEKERIKTRSEWIKEAQAAFNLYIRERDKDLPCISCQRHHTGQYHAGHCRTTKAAPELRFSENNVHKQCSSCNNYLSGNLIEYRKNLILKVGFDMVEFLESNHPPKHYTIEELKTIKHTYKAKFKALKLLDN